MVVNPARTKELTNIRTHAHDEAVRLAPPRRATLETGIEWIADDELGRSHPKLDSPPQTPPVRERSQDGAEEVGRQRRPTSVLSLQSSARELPVTSRQSPVRVLNC